MVRGCDRNERWNPSLGRLRTDPRSGDGLGSASEPSGLATVLSGVGWAVVGISTLALVLFPAAYRAIAEAVLPSTADADLIGWRLVGLLGVSIGGLLIYFGALAL